QPAGAAGPFPAAAAVEGALIRAVVGDLLTGEAISGLEAGGGGEGRGQGEVNGRYRQNGTTGQGQSTTYRNGTPGTQILRRGPLYVNPARLPAVAFTL